jgi:outer membrane protein assembly factor BamB
MFGPKVSSTTRAGHETWEVTPGSGTVPSATVVDGVAIVGDGYSSTSLVGLDTKTGATKWTTPLGDNGAGPVDVEGDNITFTTESCTVYVADAHTGAIRWQKWLGDPLVSHPTIASNVVYVVAPKDGTSTTHALFAFDARDGNEKWHEIVGADAIGAPVVLGGRIYVSTQDGTVTRFSTSGKVTWTVAAGAISAPVPDGAGNFFVVSKTHSVESLRRIDDGTSPKLSEPWHPLPASEVDNPEGETAYATQGRFDQAKRHLGTADGATLWSWQGGKPFVADGRVFAMFGGELVAFDQKSGQVLWTTFYAHGAAPPVAQGSKVFVATASGNLDVREVATGTQLESIPIGASAAFPPVINRDRIIVSTTDGRVISIKL